ncbi:MAG TPA: GNAT family N-acetyltransferase [Xanthobacteraceae bacterium]|jgi:CelD/BcsL family acetyltransferase involved in cellulose biosynthesis|nr:GNAT family N-acetyltransferase [Xanthobacteraceae bacterium]
MATKTSTASAIASARRAAIADRYAASSLAVEWRNLSELESIVDEWRDLATRVLEPNVFYEPAFALPATRIFGRDAGALLVWSGTSPRKLLGFFPSRIETRRYGFKLPVLVGWTNPYAPLGTPLVEREAAEPVIAAWLAYLADDPELPGLVLLPFLPTDGPFATALDAIVRRAQMPVADFNLYQRAQLVPDGDRLFYVERTVGQHRHKELRRYVRRLGDIGALLFTTATEPETVAGAIEDFFKLETRGWKGKAGTAAALHDDIRNFIASAVNGLAAEGKVAINRIFIDGSAIAVTIMLRSADTAWFWKIVYDEKFAQQSPGVVLAFAVTEDLVEDTTLVRTDSCATADHPMIDHVWRDRLTLCDRLIAVRPQASFSSVRRLEMLRNAAIAAAKAVRNQMHR